MVADGDVDLEGLQAQIDLSMSFAHNLVTSWIKPIRFAQLNSNGINATHLLEAELRRPPRLGVGVPIPTGSSLAQEASELKRRLGKHGAKSEGDIESRPQVSLVSDDEEHKGRPAKRKIKVDPFRREYNKKKKRSNSETNSPFAEDDSKHSVPLLKNTSVGEPQNHNSFSMKEKRRMDHDQRPRVTEGEQLATPSPPVRSPFQTTISPVLAIPTPPSISGQSGDMFAPVSPKKSSTTGCNQFQPKCTPSGDKDKPLGIPLLNLDGPPELTDNPGEASELSNSKKKRKRRKKKKTKMNIGTGDNPR